MKKLVLTHLGPYTSAQPAIDMASMYYGKRGSPEIWDKIVQDAKKNFSRQVVLAEDAMVIDIA